MTTPVPTSAPRRRRFRAWLRRLFGQPAGPGPQQPATMVSEYRKGEPLELPADGGVFHFTIHIDLTWSARGMSRGSLNYWIGEYHDSAIRLLRNAIWSIARAHLPHQPEVVERAMNEALREGWCFGDPGEVVSCVAAVQVVADRRVLDRHLPLWEQLAELDLRYRLEHRRIDHVVELLVRWRDLIEELGDGPVVAQAAKLADTDVATTLEGLAVKRLALGTDLVSVLEKARNAHGQVGLFELAKSYDVAVRTFERQAGLNVGVVSVGGEDTP